MSWTMWPLALSMGRATARFSPTCPPPVAQLLVDLCCPPGWESIGPWAGSQDGIIRLPFLRRYEVEPPGEPQLVHRKMHPGTACRRSPSPLEPNRAATGRLAPARSARHTRWATCPIRPDVVLQDAGPTRHTPRPGWGRHALHMPSDHLLTSYRFGRIFLRGRSGAGPSVPDAGLPAIGPGADTTKYKRRLACVSS